MWQLKLFQSIWTATSDIWLEMVPFTCSSTHVDVILIVQLRVLRPGTSWIILYTNLHGTDHTSYIFETIKLKSSLTWQEFILSFLSLFPKLLFLHLMYFHRSSCFSQLRFFVYVININWLTNVLCPIGSPVWLI